MSEFTDKAKDGVEVSKNLAILIREMVLVLLIVIAISSPARVVKIMTSLGVTDWNAFGLKGSFAQATKVDDTVHQLQDTVGQIQSKLSAIQNKTDLPSGIKQDVQQLQATVTAAKQNVDDAQKSIQRDVVQEQKKLTAAGFVPPSQGWLYVGRVSEDKSTWLDGPKNVQAVAPNPATNTWVTTTNAVVLRDPSSSAGNRAGGEIVAGVEPNSSLKVLDTDYSHAKAGGNFLWLKVSTR